MTQKKSPAKRTVKTVKTPSTPVVVIDNSMSREEMIARRAYRLWEERGRPLGSPEEDWYRAKEELQAGA